MAHFERFADFTDIEPTTDTRNCTLLVCSILPHCPEKQATHQARKGNGSRVLLCRYCVSYIEAFQWAARMLLPLRGETQIAALAMVWRLETGFVVPTVEQGLRSLRYFGGVMTALDAMVKEHLLQKINGRYLLRDACPACYRRGAHSKDCGLRFDPEHFAVRRESYVTG